MSSESGRDTCSLEITAVTDSYFTAYIQEEQSNDNEVNHGAPETYGYVSILEGLLKNTGDVVIGQVGRVTFTQPNKSTWFSVSYDVTISNPVVIMRANSLPDSLASSPGGTKDYRPGHIRIKDVTDTGFLYQFEEWEYLTAFVNTERPETEAVFLVLQEGAHDLSNGGITIQMTAQTVQHEATNPVSFTTVTYSEVQDELPVVLAQTQTETAGNSESESAVVVRMTNFGNTTVDVNLSNEEKYGHRTGHNFEETIGVITYLDSNTEELDTC